MAGPRHDSRDPAQKKFGKKVVSYPSGNQFWPAIDEEGTRERLQTGAQPAFGQENPDPTFKTALLTGHSTVGDDTDKSFATKYETLPGPWAVNQDIDKETKTLVQVLVRKNVSSNIAVGTVYSSNSKIFVAGQFQFTVGSNAVTVKNGNIIAQLAAGDIIWCPVQVVPNVNPIYVSMGTILTVNTATSITLTGNAVTANAPALTDAVYIIRATPSLVVTEKRQHSTRFTPPTADMNVFLAQEIVTILILPDENSLGNALVEYATRSYAYPARINAFAIQVTGLTDLYHIRPKAENIPVIRYTYWVVSQTTPSISLDTIILEGVIPLNFACSVSASDPQSVGPPFRDVLHDDVIETYGYNPCGMGNSLLSYFWPATIPSFSQYEGIITLSGTLTLTNGSATVGGSAAGSLVAGDYVFGALVSGAGALASAWTGVTGTATDPQVTRPSSGWKGHYKNIFGEVKSLDYQTLWKITIESILMR